MGKKVLVFAIVFLFVACTAATALATSSGEDWGLGGAGSVPVQSEAGDTGDETGAVQAASGNADTVSSVTISPTTAKVPKGGAIQFSAKVNVTGDTAKTVNWDVDSTLSYIDDSGLLTVAEKETKKKLKVTVSSTIDPSKAATATVTVTAAEPEPTDPPDPSDSPGGLQIDGSYIQDGMNNMYRNGYTPTIANNTAYVVLPLSGNKGVTGQIYCTLALGEDGPFVTSNYDNIPFDQKFSGTPFYVAMFQLPLKGDRVNGTYPLAINVRYTEDGVETTQEFGVNVRITDGKKADGGDTPDPDEPTSAPKVIMSNYTVSPDPVYAGETFTVNATLKNTSKDTDVQNITVNFKGQTTDLIPEGGTSTTYIDEIPAEGTQTFTFKMEARGDAEPGPQKIDVSVDYEGDKAASYNMADEIVVQIRQHTRLEYDEPNFPPTVYIGDTITTTLNLYNKGKNTLYNVTVYLEVPGIDPESSSFLGNMETGTSKSADIYASVGMNGDAVPGPAEGEFRVTYEDEYGEESELKIPVSTEIMEMMMPEEPIDEGMDMPEEPQGFKMPWWGWIVIAGGGAAAAGIIVSRARKAKREKELLEDMDDDELT